MKVSNSGSANSQKAAVIWVPKIGFKTVSIDTMIRNSAVIINKAIKNITPLGELEKFFR
ncbi:MAG: hypothetical protein WBM09_00795 [Gallionella sp.]